MAQVNINAGNISSVNLRNQGSNPSAPASGNRLFSKTSGVYFIDDSGVISGPLGSMFTPGGRISMTSGTAVTTTDISSGTSLWYNPYVSNVLPLWDGNKWVITEFNPTVIDISSLSGTSSFDVFSYNNSGVAAFETSMWTSPTVRATGISIQNGKLCKTGDATRLYLGSFYTHTAGKTSDSLLNRLVWNYYNRRSRLLYITDSNSHTYTTAAWRYWNNSDANRIFYICGVVEDSMSLCVNRVRMQSSSETVFAAFTINIDVSNADGPLFPLIGNYEDQTSQRLSGASSLFPTLGYHYLAMLEYASGATVTFPEYEISGSILG